MGCGVSSIKNREPWHNISPRAVAYLVVDKEKERGEEARRTERQIVVNKESPNADSTHPRTEVAPSTYQGIRVAMRASQ